VPREFLADDAGLTDQIDADAEVTCRRERAIDDPRRRMIAAHGVNCYAHA
jgi:hypothetical protein